MISSPIRFLYLTLACAESNKWLEEYKNDHDETLLQVLDSGFDGNILGPAFTWNLTAGEIFLEETGFKKMILQGFHSKNPFVFESEIVIVFFTFGTIV